MVAQLLFAAKSQFFGHNGDVLTLGTVDITYSLTALPAITYQDSAKTVTNDFPIQLTAAGKADIYLDAGSYNIVTRSRDGVVVDTTNNHIIEDHSQVNIGGNTPIGGIIMYAGVISAIPEGWHLCDGSDGTPALQDRFVKGTVYQDNIGDSGGSADTVIVAHTHAMLHTHDLDHVHSIGAHNHTISHTHTITHNHTMPHTHSQPNHTHSIAHNHSDEGAHQHYVSVQAHAAHGDDQESVEPLSSGFPLTDEVIQFGGDHSHNYTGNSGSSGDDTTGASSEGSTGGTNTANTGGASDGNTGTEPVTTTSVPNEATTTDASNPQTGTSGVTGVGANDPEYYTLAYIMRMS